MDYKTLVSVEIKKDDRSYIFLMPHGAPIGEAYDAGHKFLEAVMEMAKTAVEKSKPIDNTEGSTDVG